MRKDFSWWQWGASSAGERGVGGWGVGGGRKERGGGVWAVLDWSQRMRMPQSSRCSSCFSHSWLSDVLGKCEFLKNRVLDQNLAHRTHRTR
jgi:hypothetical protein